MPSARTAAAIINIAAYTGMRLGEICNLRCADIEMIEGVACFQVRPHSETGWSPKTQAGTRIVPIHSELIAKGILSFMKPDQVWLFPDLVVTKTGDRSASFSQAFARLRSRAGLPREVCFHSFRHTVSTKLRNTGHELREIWIDRLLGHEATHRSQGTMNYTSAIDVPNLKRVVEAIGYETLDLAIP
ncbi:tyrosine-type recombinase/integrase [Asaia spathodeae]